AEHRTVGVARTEQLLVGSRRGQSLAVLVREQGIVVSDAPAQPS
ncbi:MAG: hypothetical protein ACI9SE_004241, partial [Neolewinella sp.]